jgi:hypothetical protein
VNVITAVPDAAETTADCERVADGAAPIGGIVVVGPPRSSVRVLRALNIETPLRVMDSPIRFRIV